MFIFAAASALKNQGRNTFVSSYKNLNYFKISVPEKKLNFFQWYLVRFFRKLKLVKNYDFKNGWEDHSKQITNLEGNIILTGYFQGLHYFEHFQNDIRRKFEIKKKYRRKYDDYMAPYKNNKIVAIQIRRTDYQEFNDSDLMGPDLTLPLSYYTELMDELRKKQFYQFIVMSDDKHYLHDDFERLPDVIISDNDEIIDLQILIHADVCVISPSSFGWWGAWLNHKPEKVIYIPEFYLGFKVGKEYPFGIIPAGWNKVKV